MKLKGISEAEFTRQVIELAKLHKWRVAHFRTVRIQRKNGQVYYETPVQGDGAGFPDLILVRGHECLAVELKVGKNKTTPEQRAWLRALGDAGFEEFVWTPDDWELIERWLS